MDPLIKDYIRAAEARRLSPGTIRTARSVLTRLYAHLGKPLARAAPSDLADWQAQRAGEVSARTLRTQVSVVRTFYAWATEEEHTQADPSRRMRPPKVPHLLPRPIAEQRLALAMEAADDRTRAVMALAGFAGLRAAEIAGLAWSDVQLDEGWLRVVGKGSKERVVPISADLASILRALPNRRGPVIRRGDDRPGHNTANRISKMGNAHLHSLGIPDTLHSLRHRLLTQVTRAGGLRTAQEIAGHESPTTTALYAKVSPDDLVQPMLAAGRLLL